MTDDFSNYPKSIGELRADRNDMEGLTPRDILVDLLRRIDNGENISNLVMAYTVKKEGREYDNFHFASSCQTLSITIALHTLGAHEAMHR